jgi:hypothetical protein
MRKYDYTLIRGDAKLFNLTFTRAGAPVDITDWTVTLALFHGGTPIVTKVVTVHTFPLLGKSQVGLLTTDTADLVLVYDYTLKITDASGNVATVLYGLMKFMVIGI